MPRQVLRGQKVLLDAELAALYGITTARLNQQVRRNRERFPADFFFELTAVEFAALMLQNASSKPGRLHSVALRMARRRFAPG
ncbi:MAG: ORF6N domain-containing protein [Steroidobacteraceae bacterium]